MLFDIDWFNFETIERCCVASTTTKPWAWLCSTNRLDCNPTLPFLTSKSVFGVISFFGFVLWQVLYFLNSSWGQWARRRVELEAGWRGWRTRLLKQRFFLEIILLRPQLPFWSCTIWNKGGWEVDFRHWGASSKPASTDDPVFQADAWYRPTDAGLQEIFKTFINGIGNKITVTCFT